MRFGQDRPAKRGICLILRIFLRRLFQLAGLFDQAAFQGAIVYGQYAQLNANAPGGASFSGYGRAAYGTQP